MPSGILAFGAFFNALGAPPCAPTSSRPTRAPLRKHRNFRIISLLRTHLGSMRSTAFLNTHVGSLSNISLAVRVTNPRAYPCVDDTLVPQLFPRHATSPAFTTTTTSPLDPSREYVGLSFPCSARARRDANRPTISPRASTRRTREPSRFGTFLASARAASLTARARGT